MEPIRVTAEILPGKPDPSAEAIFTNGSRAGQYADLLTASGDYSGVFVEVNGERFRVTGPERA